MEMSIFKELIETIRIGQEQTAQTLKLAMSTAVPDSSKEPYSSMIGRKDIAEERFRILDLNVPELPKQEKERKLKISEWLGCIVPLIFSHGFEMLRKETIDEKGVKTHCSEMLLLAVLKLTKKNGLTADELAYINEVAMVKVLGHNILKYPQSSETQKNSEMEEIIISRNDIGRSCNSLIAQSGIEFAPKPEHENYNQEIMRFFNYLIGLSGSKNYSHIANEYLVNELGLRKERFLNPEQRKNNLPLAKRFEKDMKSLFELIQDEYKVYQMNQYDPKKHDDDDKIEESEERIYQREDYLRVTVNRPKSSIFEMNRYSVQNEEDVKSKFKYKEEVKSYTSFAIGSKISPNTDMFTPSQIQDGNLTLRDSALFRVATKWVEELEENFKPDVLLNREHPFLMRSGEEADLKRWQIRRLNDFIQYYKSAPGGPDEFLEAIARNNYQMQADLAKEDCPGDLIEQTVEEVVVGRFATTVQRNQQSYIVGYLNCLIRALVQASESWRRLLLVEKIGKRHKMREQQKEDEEEQEENQAANQGKRFYVSLINLKKLDKRYERWKDYRQIEDTDELNKTPNLVSFTIGDLLRCKLSSHYKEVMALYKKLEEISKEEECKFLKILRVKNRMETGNRDILLNLRYRDCLTVQIQLGIKSNKIPLVEKSNTFNHYLYELKRSKFGAVAEACSIWSSKDPRASKYCKYLKANSQILQGKEFEKKECRHPIKDRKIIQLPFACSQCHQYYQGAYLDSYNCKACSRSICLHCRPDKEESKRHVLKKELGDIITKLKIYNPSNLLEKINKESLVKLFKLLPNSCYIVSLNVPNMIVRQVKKAIKGQKLFYFSQKQTQKESIIYAQAKIESKKDLKEFLRHSVLAVGQIDYDSKKEKRQADEKYFMPKLLKEGIDKEKQSVRIEAMGLTDEVIQKANRPGKKWSQVLTLNLSNNQLKDFNTILDMRPKNIHTLNLSDNTKLGFKKRPDKCGIFQIEQMTSLSEINLSNCGRIAGILEEISTLNKLKKIIIQKSDEPNKAFEGICGAQQLETLILAECKGLQTLCLQKLLSLQNLTLLSNSNLRSISNTFGEMHCVQYINISKCNNLVSLPDSIGKLYSLQELQIRYNKQLKRLPSFSSIKSLKVLRITNNYTLRQLPKDIGKLQSLQILDIHANTEIETLPQTIGQLSKLRELIMYCCKSIRNLPQSLGDLSELEILDISLMDKLERHPESVGKLTKLIKYDADNSLILKELPESICKIASLKILQVSECPKLKKLPDSFGSLTNLQAIDISRNHSLVGLPDSFCHLSSLKKLKLYQCLQLNKLPDFFDKLAALQVIDISKNDSLVGLPDSFCQLQSLKILKLSVCPQIKKLPDSFGKLVALQELNMSNNNSLTDLPDSFCQLISLKILLLDKCSQLNKLPKSFGKLVALQDLDLSQNGSLIDLPDSFCELQSLKLLNLWRCPKLKKLPDSFGLLAALQELNLNNNQSFVSLPDSFCDLSSLKILKIWKCTQLRNLPDMFGKLKALQELDMNNSDSLVDLPNSFCQLSSLRLLNLWKCPKLEKLPDSFGKLTALQSLDISLNELLTTLPNSFGSLSSLKTLNLEGCSQLKELPDSFGKLICLQDLDISSNDSLIGLSASFGQLSNLKKLKLFSCPQLRELPDSFGQLTSLQVLDISNNGSLSGLPDNFGLLHSLKSLQLYQCPQLKKLPDSFGLLTALQILDISNNDSLIGLPSSFGLLSSLKILSNEKCPRIKKLPDSFGKLAALQELNISHNDSLSDLGDSFCLLSSLKQLNICECRQLQQLPKDFELLKQNISKIQYMKSSPIGNYLSSFLQSQLKDSMRE